ncbi:MAG: hypothetical protein FWE16_04270 [Firmicutes bacterium]|nr:hypothetical protein [Bacillota bacterium]
MKNQRNGIVSIILGVLLFVPLVLPLVVFRTTILNRTNDNGQNAFDLIGNLGDIENTWLLLTGIFSIVTMVVAALLIVFGVMLFLANKKSKLGKRYSLITLVGCAVGLVTAVFAIIFVISTDNISLFGIAGAATRVGIGAIILAVVGAIGIAQAFVLPKK